MFSIKIKLCIMFIKKSSWVESWTLFWPGQFLSFWFHSVRSSTFTNGRKELYLVVSKSLSLVNAIFTLFIETSSFSTYKLSFTLRRKTQIKMLNRSMIPNQFNSFRPNPGRTEKINWNFYFHTLCYLKRFYEDLEAPQRCVEIKI